MKLLRATFPLIALGAGVALSQDPPLVQVTVGDSPTGDVRLLVDATAGSADFDYIAVNAPNGIAALDGVRSTDVQEIIAFTERRPPTVFRSFGGGRLDDLPFDPEISLNLHVWIARGPFGSVKEDAVRHVGTAREIFREERLGLKLGPTTYIDATGVSAHLLEFNCDLQRDLEAAASVASGRERRTNVINVYYVDTVEDDEGVQQPNFGHRCIVKSGFAVIAEKAGDGLLAHELGHNLGLKDILAMPTMGAGNVMEKFSDSRRYFTEGQTFRTILHSWSAVNVQYQARGQKLQRYCDTFSDNAQEKPVCPPIDLRLWDDDVVAVAP